MSRRMYKVGDRVKLNWIEFNTGPSREDFEKYIGKVFVVERVWNNMTTDPEFQDLDLAGMPYSAFNHNVEPAKTAK